MTILGARTGALLPRIKRAPNNFFMHPRPLAATRGVHEKNVLRPLREASSPEEKRVGTFDALITMQGNRNEPHRRKP
jgi:hypothetical protein